MKSIIDPKKRELPHRLKLKDPFNREIGNLFLLIKSGYTLNHNLTALNALKDYRH